MSEINNGLSMEKSTAHSSMRGIGEKITIWLHLIVNTILILYSLYVLYRNAKKTFVSSLCMHSYDSTRVLKIVSTSSMVQMLCIFLLRYYLCFSFTSTVVTYLFSLLLFPNWEVSHCCQFPMGCNFI